MGVSKSENTAHGILPDFGAIFMSNRMTRKECLKRRLFGLPSWQGYFVKQIKAGMILFLFEYEKRLLHGVFRASSDGAMNIVPHAYSSSGKQFPAQVRFSIIWYCNPLSEDQFRNVIKENYFSAKKFNFGLSEEQVRRLLSLFSLTKINDRLHLRQLSSRVSLECSSDYLTGEGQNMADDGRIILNGRLRGKEKVGEDQVNTMEESVPLEHYNVRNIIPSPENHIHYCHMDNKNLTYNSGFQSNAQIKMPSLSGQSDFMTSMPFQTAVYSANIAESSETQSQINLSCFEPNLPSLSKQELETDGSLRVINSSLYASHELNYSHHPAFSDQNEQNIARQENTDVYHMHVPVTKEFPSQLFSHELKYSHHPAFSDQNEQNIARQEDTEADYLHISVTKEFPSRLFSNELNYSHYLAFPDQNEQNIARQENPEAYYMHDPGKKEFPSKLPPHEPNYSHHPSFPDQNEQNIGRQENSEACYMHVPVPKEFSSQLPFDSVKLSSLPPYEQRSANHGPEQYENFGSKHSDRARRDSVFSRLAYPADASTQEFDSSIDDLISVLRQHHRKWEKTNYEVPNQGQVDGRRWMKKKQTKSSFSSFSNCFGISDELRMNIEDNIEDNCNQIALGTPFVNFKRRKKTCKIEDDTPTGSRVNTGSDQLSGGYQKRRKLIRPSFAKNELCDCGDINNNVTTDLKDSSKERRIFGERAGNSSSVETIETQKLPQNAELPDIIWLVNNEEEITGSGSIETKSCWGSPRSGSEDGKESNYISVPDIASTPSGLDNICSTDKGSTLNDHMADGYSQNLNNTDFCDKQESTAEDSEVNAENSTIMVDEGGNKCNEKGLVKSMEIAEEPCQGTCGIIMENTIERSRARDSVSGSVLEEVIDISEQSNEQGRSINEL